MEQALLMAIGGILGAAVASFAWLYISGELGDEKPEQRLKAYAPISEAEVLSRLLGAAGSPVYQAITVVIDEEVVELLDEAMDPGLAQEQLRHRLGGADALTGLKRRLEEKIEEARARERDKEEAPSGAATGG